MLIKSKTMEDLKELVSPEFFFYTIESENGPIWLCIFPPNSRWIIYGRAKLSYIFGEGATIFGAGLKPLQFNVMHIFSPTTHTPIDIRISPLYSNLTSFPTDCLKKAIAQICPQITPMANNSIFEILDAKFASLNPSSSVFLFESLQSRVCDSIEELKRFKGLFSIDSVSKFSNQSTFGADNFLIESATDMDEMHYIGFRENEEMKNVTSKIIVQGLSDENKNLKIILCGPRNSGKSTFMRFLVNRLLTSLSTNSIAVLDCDVGQSEFTPSGMLSLTLVHKPLFGPPFTHPFQSSWKPVRQCFFGANSPSENPSFYGECLRFVYKAYEDLPNPKCPLLINTMGWTQGLGLTLLVDQIHMTRPNLVIQIFLPGRQANSRTNLPPMTPEFLRNSRGWPNKDLTNEVFEYELHMVPSAYKVPINVQGPPILRLDFNAADHRDLTFLSHFLTSVESADTSLPGSGPNGRPSLGHPASHILDCLPYHVPIAHPLLSESSIPPTDTMPKGQEDKILQQNGIEMTNLVETSASSLSPAITSNVQSPEDTEVPWSLAVHMLHPPMGVHRGNPNLSLYNLPTIMGCLNATLVGLCRVDECMIIPPSSSGGLTLISGSPVGECYGLAIVRAVDPSSGLIFLTTGIPLNELEKVNAIFRGQVNFPLSLFVEQPVPKEAFLSTESIEEMSQLTHPPYLGPQHTQGAGRTAVNTRRYYPQVRHHNYHRTSDADMPLTPTRKIN